MKESSGLLITLLLLFFPLTGLFLFPQNGPLFILTYCPYFLLVILYWRTKKLEEKLDRLLSEKKQEDDSASDSE